MNHRSISIRNTALTALALSLTLSACSPAKHEPAPSASPSAAASTPASPTTTATPSEIATIDPIATATAIPSPTLVPEPAPAPVETKPAPPSLATFTFPDGHISFSYPANWSIKTEQGPYLDYTGGADKAKSVEAYIYDETGNKVARFASGGYGGGAAGPVSRTVLDSQLLPDFPNRDGEVGFGFVMDYSSPDGITSYFMSVMDDQFLVAGPNQSSPSSVLLAPNGAAAATVIFDTPAFKSPTAAKAWMNTPQYSQLKAMLTSLRYV